jgi:hypothetical protein
MVNYLVIVMKQVANGFNWQVALAVNALKVETKLHRRLEHRHISKADLRTSSILEASSRMSKVR